jgi:hypothetical protein
VITNPEASVMKIHSARLPRAAIQYLDQGKMPMAAIRGNRAFENLVHLESPFEFESKEETSFPPSLSDERLEKRMNGR